MFILRFLKCYGRKCSMSRIFYPNEKHPWWSAILVKLQTEGLQLYYNSIASRLFSRDLPENFHNSFFTQHPQIASCFRKRFCWHNPNIYFTKHFSRLLEPSLHDESKNHFKKENIFIYSPARRIKINYTQVQILQDYLIQD